MHLSAERNKDWDETNRVAWSRHTDTSPTKCFVAQRSGSYLISLLHSKFRSANTLIAALGVRLTIIPHACHGFRLTASVGNSTSRSVEVRHACARRTAEVSATYEQKSCQSKPKLYLHSSKLQY